MKVDKATGSAGQDDRRVVGLSGGGCGLPPHPHRLEHPATPARLELGHFHEVELGATAPACPQDTIPLASFRLLYSWNGERLVMLG